MNYRIIILLFSLVCFIGCSRHNHDARLLEVADIVADKPKEALARLDSIDAEQLSAGDRAFYDFLTVKGRDKAFITHTSDSLIMSVLKQAEKHPDADYYPEVLYYCARVYTDLGDYPTALQYYRSALDKLPPETDKMILRRNVLNHMAWVLNNLDLFQEAIPIFEQILEINRRLNRPKEVMHDLHLLGHVYMRAQRYRDAERCLREAFKMSKNYSAEFQSKSFMLLAALKYRLGDIDSALMLIRHTPESVQPHSRNLALSYAADIYLAAGILDTAYMYAKELINEADSTNRDAGYDVMLSPKMSKYVSLKERERYVKEYVSFLKGYYDANDNQLALNQQSLYNYKLHDRDRREAEESNVQLRYVLAVCTLIIFLFIILMLYMNNRRKARIIELHAALANIEKLKKKLNSMESTSAADTKLKENVILTEPDDAPTDADATIEAANNEDILRHQIREELLLLSKRPEGQKEVSSFILTSSAYMEIQERVAKNMPVPDSDPLWNEIEAVVTECAPNFKENLNLLTLGKLKTHEFHTALLIKCGISPTHMAILFSKSKSAMGSRRESLCRKIFDKKMEPKVFDMIIRQL